MCILIFSSFFFFNDTATTEIYTLSLHDALPISAVLVPLQLGFAGALPLELDAPLKAYLGGRRIGVQVRSEEHTSELQSPCNLVCRLLLEKKKKKKILDSINSVWTIEDRVETY